jgi:hypothetical protein
MPDDPRKAFETLVSVLNTHRIRYALVGGLAVGVRGRIRATQDIDILLTVPQVKLPPLLDSLAGAGFQIDLYESISAWNRDHMLNFSFGPVGVDWLKAIIPPFQRVLDRARWEEMGDTRVCVADAEGLLLLKLIAFRPRDQEDIRGILAANPGSLDLDWVRREWSVLSSPDDPKTPEFERLLREFYRESRD